MPVEKNESKLRFFGRFPKSNFAFDSTKFISEYNNIISSKDLTDKLLGRMVYRYGTNDLKKASIVNFVKENSNEGLSTESLCKLFECDKNTIFAIGQEIEISIRLFIQKKFYAENGRNEIMLDEMKLTPRTFNYILNRGYTTKSAVVEAYKNGYISSEKIRQELNEKLHIENKESSKNNSEFGL